MFRIRTLLVAVLVGAAALSTPAVAAPSTSNIPVDRPIRAPFPPVSQPPMRCCRAQCPVCPPGKICPMYCVLVCTHC